MNNSINNQDIFLSNRKELKITNVKKINTLNNLLFDIETGLGRLKIEGKDLDMISLDNDKEILLLKGLINKIEYLDKQKNNKESSFVAKLFK
jgi:sporulation protein YabP